MKTDRMLKKLLKPYWMIILGAILIAASMLVLIYFETYNSIAYVVLAIGGIFLILSIQGNDLPFSKGKGFDDFMHNHPRTVTYLSHISFWLTYLMIHTTLMKLNLPDTPFFKLAFSTTIFFLPIDILATYFTLYILMPKLLYKRKYLQFIFAFTLSAIPFILLTQVIHYYIYVPLMHPEYAYAKSFWEFGYFYYIVATYGIVVLAAAIKLTKRWFEVKDRQAELENQNLKSELAMLKLQISPHFLFNTLNNVDSLMYSDKEKASEVIVRLSDIMRYMLYESQHGKVPLSKEIEYLNNLIELHSLRLTKPGFIELTIKGEIAGKMISPLLFIPFVENAIKHGAKNVEVPGIQMDLVVDDSHLIFRVVNAVDKEAVKDADGGIGLNNVKRRLELLYPGSHELIVKESAKDFFIELVLDL